VKWTPMVGQLRVKNKLRSLKRYLGSLFQDNNSM
jgi:hypothetical protein